ncbi:MAG TPA: N-acetylneuraminate synthase, partial [Cytophagales bacterium]|nr:N-acetylneuraminate synthase [Cytophagales bacterium]
MWKGKHGVYLIAEVGGNHGGNFDKAQKLTQLACASGVDA